MARSEFKRLQNIEKGLPKSGVKFLEKSGLYIPVRTLKAGWVKGDVKNTKDYVLVLENEDNEFEVVTNTPEGIKVEVCENLYQAFLAHKEARFA